MKTLMRFVVLFVEFIASKLMSEKYEGYSRGSVYFVQPRSPFASCRKKSTEKKWSLQFEKSVSVWET